MIIDGKQIAKKILQQVAAGVDKLSFVPVFCDVLVGTDPASQSYVSIKGKTAQRVGMDFYLARFPESISEQELIGEIQHLNSLKNLCGLIVQLPLPQYMGRQSVLDAVRVDRDVDCLHTKNIERFYGGFPGLIPPTAAAVLELLQSVPQTYEGKKIVIVGQGALVGKPVAFLLGKQGHNVRSADHSTPDIHRLIADADVVISGTGNPRMIIADFIKPGAVVIDAGTAEMDGGIVGDVDFASVSPKAGYLSPVPGGVGPVTVAMLLKNVLTVAEKIS